MQVLVIFINASYYIETKDVVRRFIDAMQYAL